MPSSKPAREVSSSWHDFNPRSSPGRGRSLLVVMLIIFFCFVILDPWKVVKPVFLGTPSDSITAPLVPERPDLSEIKIKGRLRPIHNAVVKDILANGLVFHADEGLVKAAYRDLPPEFTQYYQYLTTLRRHKEGPAPVATELVRPVSNPSAGSVPATDGGPRP